MTADLHQAIDLSAMTIRELLAELTRVEDRLNSQRAAAGYGANPEIARLQRRMRAISAQLQLRRGDTSGAEALDRADEADLLEQSMPVDADPEEEYPRSTTASSSC